MSRPRDASVELSRGESVEVAQKDGESASAEALPEGWAEAKLGEVAQLINGDRGKNYPNKSALVAEGIPFINAGHIEDDGRLDRESMNFITRERFDLLGSGKIQKGDILYCLRGSLGKTAIIRDLDEGAIASSLVIMRAGDESNVGFLYNFLVSPLGQERIEEYDNGTAQPNLAAKSVRDFSVPLPPKAEQSRIVSAIESLQERSSRARVLLSEVGPLIGQLRQSVLRDAFSGKLTADWRAANPDFEPASELLSRIRTERRERWQSEQLAKYEAKGKQPPKNWQDKYKEPDVTFDEDAFDTEFQIDKSCGWEVVPLELLVDPEKSIPYGIVKTGDPYPNGVPTVRCGDIKRFSIAINDLKLVNPEVHEQYRRTWLEGGEVIIAIRGTVGETAVVPAEMKGMNISREVALIPVLPGVDSTFLMYLLASPAAQRLITGQVKGVAQSGINLADLRMLPTPLPSLEEQQEIARRIEEALNMLDSVLAIQASMESSLTQLDQSILSKAFRGELVPQDPRDEPASELLARIRAKRAADAAKKTSKKKKATTTKAASNAK
jgi:type I restriction enzyme S subunit